TRVWVKSYNGGASALAVDPTGHTVYVTGNSAGTNSADDYATVAYDTHTGAQLWAAHYNGPAKGDDSASSVAVAPTGHTVYVTGSSAGTNSADDYATVAYDAATGAQRWLKRYDGPGHATDQAVSVAVSPAASKLFVTGTSMGTNSGTDYATV